MFKFLPIGIALLFTFLFVNHLNSQVNVSTPQRTRIIYGIVYDINQRALDNVSIGYNNSKGFVHLGLTGDDGKFKIQIPYSVKLLVAKSFNFENAEIDISNANTKEVTFKLISKADSLDAVSVNTGFFRRSKESFTGAVNKYTGSELKAISNGNIIQSLKTLDPSFVVVTNNLTGSDPNAMPNIELRGKSSISLSSSSSLSNQFSNTSNLPLFILNGFETSLQQVLDLDINRVKSVTLLKDAASTAIYGSKAANGVVVIETIIPKPGSLLVSYSNDFRMEAPFLSDYNMMNAAEDLEFQRLAGYYSSAKSTDGIGQVANMDLYNSRLKEVQSGVNTYWLNVPLRKLGITENNSINIGGEVKHFNLMFN